MSPSISKRNIQSFLRTHIVTLIGLFLLWFGIEFWLPCWDFCLNYPAGLRAFQEAMAAEFVGIGMSVLLINWAVGIRQEEVHKKNLKESLIRDLRSRSHVHAVRAIDELRYRGWFREVALDYSLALLELEGVRFVGAALDGISFVGSNLRRANFNGATAVEIDLRSAKLEKATFFNTNLQGADFSNARLSNALFLGADLTGVSTLSLVQLKSVNSFAGSIMPDGVKLRTDGVKLGDPKSNEVNWFVEPYLNGLTFETWLKNHLIANPTLSDEFPEYRKTLAATVIRGLPKNTKAVYVSGSKKVKVQIIGSTQERIKVSGFSRDATPKYVSAKNLRFADE